MDDPVELDARRGMMAQKETEERRMVAGARADLAALTERQAAYEESLVAQPPRTRADALARAVYLLKLYAETSWLDPRRGRLIAQTLTALDHFSGEAASPEAGPPEDGPPDGEAAAP